MNKKIWITVAVIAIIGIILWQIGESRKSGDTIKVGAILSLSGGAASWGENAQKAIELAAQQVNVQGGINGKKVEIIYADDASQSKTAVSAYEKLTSVDHAVAVMGPLFQGAMDSVIPVAYHDGTPLIDPGTATLKGRTNLKNPLLIWMDPVSEADRIAQYVFSRGIRRAAVIGTLDSWENIVSNAFAQKFRSLGGTITDEEIVQPTVADMGSPATKVVATHPQAVFMGTYFEFIQGTEALNELGYSGKLYGIEADDYLASQSYSWTKGLQFIAPDFYTSDFIATFKSAYGEVPGLPAGQAYDASNILFSFLKKSTKQSDILNAMAAFTSYDGVSGPIQITSDGTTLMPTAIFEIGATGTIQRVAAVQ
jgi:branched-chain amino acid transport system substrate-binding protein